MDTPAWATTLRLPDKATLDYLQAVALTTGIIATGLYLIARTLSDPTTIKRAARHATGA